jgi:predicted AAA+ superfamily ATPase
LNPTRIIETLSVYYDAPVVPGETLIFLDEIQSCPQALSSLRFFYEKMPDLHVIAAGSLLEIDISGIPSFGVGRIRSLFLFPMTFFEYLDAKDSCTTAPTVISRSFSDEQSLLL